MKKLLAACLVLALVLPGGPLAAQQAGSASDTPSDSPPKTVGPPAYGPAAPAKKCSSTDPKRPGEIVVCGTKDDSEFRVKSSAQLDPNSKEALDDGRPHAPDFAESCKKNPQGACITLGSAPVPVYMLKFEDLPDTPEGSDADKIAKGEKKGGD